ncbi:MAG: hypothetical protein OER97_08585, partial [Gammaproteobacteria bacterium]|nr:hypothetical protein [Gammaproteobacteria bacterium]
MIWSSKLAMTTLDLVIIGLILAMFAVTWSMGMFKKGRTPRGGRILVMLGVSLTGLFYLADLIIMHLPRALLDPDRAIALMNTLHLEFRWFVELVSLVVISIGIVMDAYQRYRTEDKIRASEKQVAVAQDRVIESEIRFRSMVEQTTDAMFCFEFQPPVPIAASIKDQIACTHNAVLIECNRVFANSVDAESREQIIGNRFRS